MVSAPFLSLLVALHPGEEEHTFAQILLHDFIKFIKVDYSHDTIVISENV